MDDYISRAEAVTLAMQYCPDDDGVCSKAGHDLRELVDDLENAPPADVRPVPEGGIGEMSIYIKGFDIPQDGIVRVIMIESDGSVRFYGGSSVIARAVEVPPHGRLIDADELMDGWMNLREATKYGNKTKEQITHSYSTMMMYEIANEIDDAETIIPADREEPT